MAYGINVKVSGQPVVLQNADMRHKFTVRDLKEKLDEYQIPYDRSRFMRFGVMLGDDSEIANGDFIVLEAPKAGEG